MDKITMVTNNIGMPPLRPHRRELLETVYLPIEILLSVETLESFQSKGFRFVRNSRILVRISEDEIDGTTTTITDAREPSLCNLL